MGTSGSYGGAGGRAWDAAADALSAFLGDDGATPVDGTSADASPGGDPSAGGLHRPGDRPKISARPEDFIRRIGQALRRSDPSLRTGGGGSGRGGSDRRDGSGGSGRGGREIGRRAASAGRALAGAYALRTRDADTLRELGLDLNELQALRPTEQKQRLLDAFLGRPNHPDDAAVRKAADGFLEVILTADEVPDAAGTVREFAMSLIFEMSIVPLTEGLREERLSRRDAQKAEQTLKDWLHERMADVDLGVGDGHVDLTTLAETTRRLTAFGVQMMCVAGT